MHTDGRNGHHARGGTTQSKLHIFVKSNHWFSARLVRVRNRIINHNTKAYEKEFIAVR